MIARLLKGLWIALIVAATGAAWLSIHLLGARIGPWAAGLLGVLVVVAAHPAVIALHFVVSRIAGDPVPAEHRLSLWRAIRMYDAELDASMRGLWFGTPFRSHRPAARPAPGVALRDTPILFVHGYFCNRAVWLSFMKDAAARGYVCEAVTLPDPFGSIDSQMPAVDGAIDDLLTKARDAGLAATRVAIVAHSMGGLVARSALATFGSARVASVITLGTPHHGTHVARYGTIPSVVQMRRGGPWLSDLAARETAGPDREPGPAITTLFSWHDDIVYPQSTGALADAHQVAIGGCGHVALLYDRRVRTAVFDRLATADAGRQAASEGLAAP